MDKVAKARDIKQRFMCLIRRLSTEARLGNKQAAKELIAELTNQNLALKELGYMLDSQNRLVLINEIPSQPLTEEQQLAKAAREGDETAMKQIVANMARQL